MIERREVPQTEILKNSINHYFDSERSELVAKLSGRNDYKKVALDTAVEFTLLSDEEVRCRAEVFDRDSNSDMRPLVKDSDAYETTLAGTNAIGQENASVFAKNLLRQALTAREVRKRLMMSEQKIVKNDAEIDAASELCIDAVVYFRPTILR